MQTSKTFDAIVAIIEARNAAMAERDRQAALYGGSSFGWTHQQGIVAGLDGALNILRNAGEAVASAEYIVAGGELVGAHAPQPATCTCPTCS